ncbi:NIPSNAP family protein [Variovorax sp. KK3]|uniref:NIPSNAP family protein n=1 Tax=Variovorax sp. KK3 TaxID=1855728 RepID=UPI00097CA571|nr:NIPSNAP family protein [Variovorax sp. KK3]
MIAELRTYLLRPGGVPPTEDLFGKHLHHRTPMSPLAGLWHTLTGQLNTVMHLWPYDDIQQRTEIRDAMMRPPLWPPPLRPYLLEMDSVILLPAPYSPPLAPARHGALYEFYVDSYLPGGPAACRDAWASAIDARVKLSPLVFCGASEFGRLNQWVSIWAYRDHAHRDEVQARVARDGTWPPEGGLEFLLKQESTLAAPAACSPLN